MNEVKKSYKKGQKIAYTRRNGRKGYGVICEVTAGYVGVLRMNENWAGYLCCSFEEKSEVVSKSKILEVKEEGK